MKNKFSVIFGFVVLMLLAIPLVAMAASNHPAPQDKSSANLVQVVRQAAEPYISVEAAEAAGYGLFLGCVSGPGEGAMGVHYPNGDLVGDGCQYSYVNVPGIFSNTAPGIFGNDVPL